MKAGRQVDSTIPRILARPRGHTHPALLQNALPPSRETGISLGFSLLPGSRQDGTRRLSGELALGVYKAAHSTGPISPSPLVGAVTVAGGS